MLRYVATLATIVAILAASRAVPTAHDPIASVTWSRDVEPIVRARCAPCHYAGGPGGMPLVNYKDVAAQADAVKHAVLTRQMPPWAAARGYGAFRDDPSLTPQQVSIVASWVESRLRRGDAASESPAPATTRDSHVTPSARRLIVDVPPNLAADGRDSAIVTVAGSGRVHVTAWRFVPGDRGLIEADVRDTSGALQLRWTPAINRETFPAGTGYALRLPARVTVTTARHVTEFTGAPRTARRTPSTLELTLSAGPLSPLTVIKRPCGTTTAVAGNVHALRPPSANAAVEVRARAGNRERVLGLFRDVQPIDRVTYWLQEPMGAKSEVTVRGSGDDCAMELIVSAARRARSPR